MKKKTKPKRKKEQKTNQSKNKTWMIYNHDFNLDRTNWDKVKCRTDDNLYSDPTIETILQTYLSPYSISNELFQNVGNKREISFGQNNNIQQQH